MKQSESFLSIDDYAYRSPLRQSSAGFRVLMALLVLFLCLFFHSVSLSLYVLVTTMFLSIKKGKVPWNCYGRLLLIPAGFICLGAVAIAVEMTVSKEEIGFLITSQSLSKSVMVVSRSFACMGILFALALSTPVGELILVLQKARFPKLFIELMYLIYRYIFLLLDTQQRIWNAAKSRLGYYGWQGFQHTFGCCVSRLFLQAMSRAGKQYDAMESRCYQGELVFLEDSYPVTGRQLFFSVLYIAGMAGIYLLGKEYYWI